LLGASNTWFGVTRSALSIPRDTVNDIDRTVNANWDQLSGEDITDIKSLKLILKYAPRPELSAYTPEELWPAIERRKLDIQDTDIDPADLKFPEWEKLSNPSQAPRDDDFQITSMAVPKKYQNFIEKIVAVQRLRETSALIGFARIEAPEVDDKGQIDKSKIVSLSTTSPTWVPISDVRGEGIFIQFPENMILNWENQKHEDIRLSSLHNIWKHEWPGDRYILIHSFAHLLINEFAIECGYSAASLRERIYCRTPDHGTDAMAGILIYTAAADSEGTLGGLVAMAAPDRLGNIIEAAIRRAGRCSSDPLCAEHIASPDDKTFHGAACHSCLFLPETSCEQNNRLLERATIAETLGQENLGYFDNQT